MRHTKHTLFTAAQPWLLLLGIATAVTACDLLNPDVLPNTEPSEALLELPKQEYSLPNEGSLLIDLLSAVQAGASVEVSIAKDPEHGTLSLLNERFVEYTANASFADNGDSFVVRVAQGNDIWDQDTVVLTPSDSAGCNDGTPVYYLYGTNMDSALVFYPNPLVPECHGLDSLAETEILAPPSLGVASTDGYAIFYDPDPSGPYESQLVFQQCDGSPKCITSLLKIIIDPIFNNCELKALPDEYSYSLSNIPAEPHQYEILANDQLCGDSALEVSIVTPLQHGSAFLRGYNLEVGFEPGTQPGYDSLVYRIFSPAENAESFASVVFHLYQSDSTGGDDTTGGGDSTCFVEAFADLYFLNLGDSTTMDSAQVDTINFSFDVLANDSYCTWEGVSVEITTYPSFGSVYIDNKQIVYTRPKDGNQADDYLEYKISEGGTSDIGSVTIEY